MAAGEEAAEAVDVVEVVAEEEGEGVVLMEISMEVVLVEVEVIVAGVSDQTAAGEEVIEVVAFEVHEAALDFEFFCPSLLSFKIIKMKLIF